MKTIERKFPHKKILLFVVVALVIAMFYILYCYFLKEPSAIMTG